MMLCYFFIISENWQKINTDPVCFGARDSGYGAFNITKSGRLKTMKLVHKSGEVRCNPQYHASYWGCTYPGYGNQGLMTIITNANKESVLPPAGDLKAADHCPAKKHYYTLEGINHTSPELVFHDLPKQLAVSRNQELQIWYGQDWIGLTPVKITTVAPHVLMCMRGMLKARDVRFRLIWNI